MRLKTITAADMPTALRILRTELGPEALILSTRKVPGGADGKETLEITAALPDTATAPTPPPAKPVPLSPAAKQLVQPSDFLEAHGLPSELRTRLTAAVQGLAPAGFEGVEALEMVLPKVLAFQNPLEQLAPGHVHVFIGPHGAGKTTLMGKLALQGKHNGRKVGLLSLDDQKIAGFEPLAIAAEIVGDTAMLLHSAADLPAAAQALGSRSLLLLDTPGQTGADGRGLAQLHTRLSGLGLPVACHLVLPANLHPQELSGLPVAFQRFNPVSLIFTKLDATGHYGGLMGTAAAHSLPLGLASDSPRMDTAPLSLTAAWLAAKLAAHPSAPWEAR